MPDSAAAKAGVQEGDRVIQIGDTADPTWEDIAMKEVASAGHPLSVWVERGGERKHITLTPVLDARTGVGFAGWDEQTEIEIASALPDKPAAKAGLRAGDIIVSVNGQPIRSTPKIHDIVGSTGGKPVQVVYSRAGKTGTVTVTPALTDLDGTPEVDDRRQPAAQGGICQSGVSEGYRGIGPAKREERDADLPVSARYCGAAHVAAVRWKVRFASPNSPAKRRAKALPLTWV